MINGLLWLVACQLVGEVVVRALDLRLPGPVVGMALLFGLLQWRKPAEDAPTIRAADALLRHLQLLFVPAGVGVVTYLSLLRDEALPIVAGLLVSWLAGLVTLAGLVVLLRRRPA